MPLEPGTLATPTTTGVDSRLWDEWIAELDWRWRHDWDNIIANSGPRGSTKSTLGFHQAFALDPDFPIEHVFYEQGRWKQTIDPARKRQVYVFDEGTNIGLNWEWQSPDQRDLVKILNTCRQANSTLIWNCPNVQRLNTVIRNDIIAYRGLVRERGLATITERVFREHVVDGDIVDASRWVIRIDDLRYGPFQDTRPDFWAGYTRYKHEAFREQVRPAPVDQETYDEMRSNYLKARRLARYKRASPPNTP